MILLLALLYGLRTDRKQKLAVAAIFSLSLIVIIVAVIRAIEIRASTDHVDPVWLALWSMIEGSVGKHTSRPPRKQPSSQDPLSGDSSLSSLIPHPTQHPRALQLLLQAAQPIFLRPLEHPCPELEFTKQRHSSRSDPRRDIPRCRNKRPRAIGFL